MLTYVTPVRFVYRCPRGSVSRQPQPPHTTREAPPDWAFFCWHVRFLGSWGFLYIPHNYRPDATEKQTRQTRQYVPVRNSAGQCWWVQVIDLCVPQSEKAHKWVFGSESPFQWLAVEEFAVWHLLMTQHWSLWQ